MTHRFIYIYIYIGSDYWTDMSCLSLSVMYSDILCGKGQSRAMSSVVNTVPHVVTCSPTFLGILKMETNTVQNQAL